MAATAQALLRAVRQLDCPDGLSDAELEEVRVKTRHPPPPATLETHQSKPATLTKPCALHSEPCTLLLTPCPLTVHPVSAPCALHFISEDLRKYAPPSPSSSRSL